MEFDVYYYRPADAAAFFKAPIEVGSTVRLDGIDGFFDQYFECQEPGDEIRFTALGEVHRFPAGAEDFESLPLIEARILEADMDATVQILSVEPLGPWARRVLLSDRDRIIPVTIGRPPLPDVLTRLASRARTEGWGFWSGWPSNPKINCSETAIHTFRCGSEVRAIVLFNTNVYPSFLLLLQDLERDLAAQGALP